MSKRSARGSIVLVTSIVAIMIFGLSAVSAQQGRPAVHEQEIFCLGMSAGQFCVAGSAEVLELEGEKRESWIESTRKYNAVVAAAQREFLEEAKATLSTEEYARVEPWFDRSVNALLNQLLLAEEE